MNIVKTLYSNYRIARQDARTSFILRKRHYKELYKFRDARRIAIAKQFPLSKEQKEAIDDLYETNYGKRIGYIWHQNYAAHAGRFDYKFFPEVLYFPEFEAYQNQNNAAIELLSDKNFLPVVAKGIGIKMPQTIVDCANGVLRDSEKHIITETMAKELLSRKQSFFVKPTVDSCSGQGCVKADQGAKIEFSNGAMSLNGKIYTQDFVIQELIECNESLQRIYPYAVNTFRIITYIWKDSIQHMPISLRIGRGGKYVDNAHAGGIFVAINENGVICNHASTEFNENYECHPDTGVKFEGYKIAQFDKVLATVTRFHEAIPQIGCINWDATIDKDGNAIVLEANTSDGGVWLPQMAHGVGPFGERITEVLQWLRFMNKIKPHERGRFTAGRMG